MKIFWGKKSGRYELSQDVFVISINIGEYLLLQCTLNSESTVFDCLEYIKQKLSLKQADLFGLKYQLKAFNNPDIKIYRFIEPTKSIKKQLDKYSIKPKTVYLSILYYTPNVYALYDYTARSLYYTLLKIEVLNGIYTFDIEKYIYLAALSLQIDYGDYEPTVHTLDFLKSIQILPLHLIRSLQFFDDYLLKILTIYERQSENGSCISMIEYINEIIQDESYGKEVFNCKNDESIDIRIGYKQENILIEKLYNPTLIYKFDEVRNIVIQKRNLIFKFIDGTSLTFIFQDNDTCRYISTLFNLQIKFIKNDFNIHKSIPHIVKNLQFGIQNNNVTNVINKINYAEIGSTNTSNSLDLTTGSTHSQYYVPINGSTSHLSRTVSNQCMTNRSLTTSQILPQSSIKKNQLPPSISTPSIPHQLLSPYQISSSIVKPNNLHEMEHQILLQMLSEKKARKIGSSPEINVLSTSTTNSRYTSNNVVNKIPSTGCGKRLNGKFNATESMTLSYSTPDLLMHNISSPMYQNQKCNFSKGRVISSTVSRPIGQCITYPIPKINEPQQHCYQQQLTSRIKPIPPPLENLQSILAEVKPPVDSPDSYISEVTSSSSIQPNKKTFLIESNQNSLKSSDDLLEMNNTRHVLVNGVVLNGYPDFLKTNNNNDKNIKLNNKNGIIKFNNHYNDNDSNDSSNNDDEIKNNNETIKILIKKLKTSEILQIEFTSIPLKRITAGTTTSKLKDNINKNHPKSILPYEDTRIMLHPTKYNHDGYINASNIQIPVNDKLFKYILTQNPLKNTIQDFYQMLWETNSRIIVSLYNKYNDNYFQYFPTNNNEKFTFNDYSIKQQSSTFTNGLITTILCLKYLHTGEKRIIYHLNYCNFKKDAYGVPVSVDSFLGFIDSVNSVKRHIENEKSRDNDSGIFLSSSNNSNQTVRKRKMRSKSITRSALIDVTNRLRSHSVEQGSRLRKKLSNNTSTSSNTSENSIQSTNSSIFSTTNLNDKQLSIIIHCQDGSSISGLYVLIELIIHCIENNINIEIAKLLRLLRQQRASLINNYQQYIFVYQSILAYLQRSRLI